MAGEGRCRECQRDATTVCATRRYAEPNPGVGTPRKLAAATIWCLTNVAAWKIPRFFPSDRPSRPTTKRLSIRCEFGGG